LTMKSNAEKMLGPPYDQNPVTKLWQKLGYNGLLLSKLSEFMRLAEIDITTVLGSVEDERNSPLLSSSRTDCEISWMAISTLL
jgi:hypothetical protein